MHWYLKNNAARLQKPPLRFQTQQTLCTTAGQLEKKAKKHKKKKCGQLSRTHTSSGSLEGCNETLSRRVITINKCGARNVTRRTHDLSCSGRHKGERNSKKKERKRKKNGHKKTPRLRKRTKARNEKKKGLEKRQKKRRLAVGQTGPDRRRWEFWLQRRESCGRGRKKWDYL